ncbi:hypothetical protein [Angustibacter aerolatus]
MAGDEPAVTGLDPAALARLRRELDAAVAALEQARRDLGRLDGGGLGEGAAAVVDETGTAYDDHLRQLAAAVRVLEQALGAQGDAVAGTDRDLTL